MICAGIIEIHGAFDEAQSENAGIEIQIALWIAGNRGDVMKSGNFDIVSFYSMPRKQSSRGHGPSPSLRRGVVASS